MHEIYTVIQILQVLFTDAYSTTALISTKISSGITRGGGQTALGDTIEGATPE